MSNWNHDTILTVFVGLTALSMLVQAIVAIVLFACVNKAAKSLREQIDDLRNSVVPAAQSARLVIERIGPVVDRIGPIIDRVGPRIDPLADDISKIAANVKSASDDFVDIAHRLRKESEDVQASAAVVIERVRQQTVRVDSMVTGVLDAADKAGDFVQRAINAPARQLAGVLAAARAVIESLRSPEPDYRHNRTNSDKDMFV
jgi:methyl-accepting chemotaxis protein